MCSETRNKNFNDVGFFLFIFVAQAAALMIFVLPWIKKLLG